MNKAIQLPLIIRDRRRRHWYWIPDIIIDLYLPFLGAQGLTVYNVLSRFAERGTEDVVIKLETLAERIGISKRQVRRELRKLEKIGLISVVQRGKFHLPNEYTLLDPPEEIAFVGRATSEAPVIHKLSTGRRTGESPEGGQVSALSNVVVDITNTIYKQQHTKSKNCASSVDKEEKKAVHQALIDFGVSPDVAMELLNNEPPAPIVTLSATQGWIEYASDSSKGIRNPRGFVVDRLRKGADPPPPKIRRGSQEDRYRYLQGEYAEHIQY